MSERYGPATYGERWAGVYDVTAHTLTLTWQASPDAP